MSVPMYVPLCIDCVYLDTKCWKNEMPVCKAYPEGIPRETWVEKAQKAYDPNAPCPNGYKFKHK